MLKSLLLGSTAGLLVMGISACSSSGGGGGGGSTASNGLIRSNKMVCGTQSCIGSTAVSTTSLEVADVQPFAVTNAVTMYDTFNATLIPAFNQIIANIEAGVINAGAVSCDDISLSFTGQVTANGTTYDARTAPSSLNEATGQFSSSTMTKKLTAQPSAGGAAYVQADINCGAGTDASPLVARVLSNDGTNKYNAWYERGTANHIRISMIANYAGVVYAGWFKTDDGDNYQVILASGGQVYQGSGQKSVNKINFKDNGAGAASCIDSTTGAASTCSYTLPTSTGIPGTLMNSGSALAWASVTNGATLLAPIY